MNIKRNKISASEATPFDKLRANGIINPAVKQVVWERHSYRGKNAAPTKEHVIYIVCRVNNQSFLKPESVGSA